MLTADLGDGLFAFLGLLQDADDLGIGELVHLLSNILPFRGILTLQMVQFLGYRSVFQLEIPRSSTFFSWNVVVNS